MPSRSPTMQLLVEVPGAEVRTPFRSRTYPELSLRYQVKTQIKVERAGENVFIFLFFRSRTEANVCLKGEVGVCGRACCYLATLQPAEPAGWGGRIFRQNKVAPPRVTTGPLRAAITSSLSYAPKWKLFNTDPFRPSQKVLCFCDRLECNWAACVLVCDVLLP